MKTILCVIAVCFFFTADSQVKKTIEISGTFNSVDPILPLSISTEKFLDGGINRNNSIAYGLTAKYFIAENLAIRLKGISTNRNIKDYRLLVYPATTQIDDDRLAQNNFKMAPGIQWSFVQKKISFWGGIELPIGFYGTTTIVTNYFIQTPPGPAFTTITTYTIPGGTSVGIGFFAGTNYYFAKKWAIGFELGSAFERTIVGGIAKSRAENAAGALIVERHNEEIIDQTKFGELQAGINLIFKFH